MSGFKTWLAVIASIALAVYYILNGNIEQAWQYVLFAMALLGIGGKLDKINQRSE